MPLAKRISVDELRAFDPANDPNNLISDRCLSCMFVGRPGINPSGIRRFQLFT